MHPTAPTSSGPITTSVWPGCWHPTAPPILPSSSVSPARRRRSCGRHRATGTLRVTSGEQAASLYFVFGKLFHAEKDDLEGEDALREVLTWRPVISTLDRRSALPAKETIKLKDHEALPTKT